MKKKYHRWAVTYGACELFGYEFLVECTGHWPDASEAELPVRTFLTRKQARDAVKELKKRGWPWNKGYRVVKVLVLIQEVK